MKFRSCLLLLVSLIAGSGIASAGPATLSWSGQDKGAALGLTNGTPLAVGATVRLGYFDLDALALEPLFAEPELLNTHFTTLATTQVGNFEAQTYVGAPELNTTGFTYVEAPGCFAASLVFTPAANEAAAHGKRCFIWAMNGGNVTASTHHGIFSHHAWVLNTNFFGAVQWDLSQVSATDARDVILGHRGPQISSLIGGTVLRLTNTAQLKMDLSDDDADGTPALLEEAFAMNPTQADAGMLPKITSLAGRPALSFTRKAGGVSSSDGAYTAGGLRYGIELSADLQLWTPCPPTAQGMLEVLPGTVPGTESVTMALTPESVEAGCRFARVRVERVQ